MPTVDCISTKTQSDLKEEPKQKKSIWLTERDLQIILWINSHKAATAEQVANRFYMNVLTAKQRLCKLKQLDYLVYKKVFQNRPGVYGAGIKGITVANDSLPVARLLLGTYEHDSQLVDLSIMLEKKTGADWQTERQIRHERGLKGVGWRGHCPDGILIFTGGNRIAIELELSPKGTAKIEKILKEYAKKQYEEIWYFVNSGYLAAKIQSAALPFIKVFSWPGMKEYENMTGSSSARPLLGLTGMEEELKTVREFFHR